MRCVVLLLILFSCSPVIAQQPQQKEYVTGCVMCGEARSIHPIKMLRVTDLKGEVTSICPNCQKKLLDYSIRQWRFRKDKNEEK